MEEEECVRVVRCGGSELNFRRAVFSADSKYGANALCVRAEGCERVPGGGVRTVRCLGKPGLHEGARVRETPGTRAGVVPEC